MSTFFMNDVSVLALHSHESREVYAPVAFNLKGNACSTRNWCNGRLCDNISASKYWNTYERSKPSDAVIRGMSGLDLQNCGCNLH